MKGLLIVSYKGDEGSAPTIVKSTFSKEPEQEQLARNYGFHLSKLAKQARNLVRDMNSADDLTFLRVRCKKLEMMIAPDKEYFLIVIQSPEDEDS